MGQADRAGKDLTDEQWITLVGIMSDVTCEVTKAMRKHAAMYSPHEGHSVIREEFEELWDHVKADTGRSDEARKEAIQIAAMAIRYVMDLIDDPPERSAI